MPRGLVPPTISGMVDTILCPNPDASRVPQPCRKGHGNRPCDSCNKLKYYEQHIKNLRVALDRTIAQYQETLIEITRSHNATLLKLSPDIMSRIFQYCMPVMPERSLVSFSPVERSGPLVFGAVCKWWRYIAWNTPRLWSQVIISLDTPNLDQRRKTLRAWLKKSGELPLTIGIYGTWRFLDRAETTMGIVYKIIDVLNQYTSRWFHLNLSMPSSCFGRLHGNGEEPSKLRILRFSPSVRHRIAGMGNEFQFSVRKGQVRPEKVILCGVASLQSMPGIQWDNVTYVNVPFSLNNCLQLIKQAPKLTHCQFYSSSEATSPSDLTPQRYVYSQLRSLSIACVHPSLFDPFFDSMLCTHLTSFEWECPNLPSRSFQTFLRRSSSPLQEMKIECECADSVLLTFLKSFPSLVNLRLRRYRLLPGVEDDKDTFFAECKLDDIFKALAATSVIGGNSNLLPKLRNFDFSTTDCSPPWELIPRIFGDLEPKSGSTIQPRRPLQTLRLDMFALCDSDTGEFTEFIDKAALLQIIALLKAGFNIEIVDDERKIDILGLSMKHHGLQMD